MNKLNEFCAGRYTMDDEFDELVTKGKKTAKEVEGMKQLASEIQYAIVTRKLRPGKSSTLSSLTLSHAELLQPYCISTPWQRHCPYLARHRTHHGPRG